MMRPYRTSSLDRRQALSSLFALLHVDRAWGAAGHLISYPDAQLPSQVPGGVIGVAGAGAIILAARGDGRDEAVSIERGARVVNSGGSSFTLDDIGKVAIVDGAGARGEQLVAEIEAVHSGSSASLSRAALTSVSATNMFWATDSTDAIAAFFGQCRAQRRDGIIPRGRYLARAGVRYDAASHSVSGVGDVELNFAAMTSGVAISISGLDLRSERFRRKQYTHRFGGIAIVGPRHDQNTVDGIILSDNSDGSGVQISDLLVSGFRDQVTFGDNVWLSRFSHVMLTQGRRRGLSFLSRVNGGESLSFDGCVISNCRNRDQTAVGLYTDERASFLDINWHGGSFDFNDIEIEHNAGKISCFGTHFEDDSDRAMIQLGARYGGAKTSLDLYSAQFDLGPASGDAARSHVIEVRRNSAPGVTLHLQGADFRLFNRRTEVLADLSGKENNISAVATSLDQAGVDVEVPSKEITSVGSMGGRMSLLADGDFQVGNFVDSFGQVSGWYCAVAQRNFVRMDSRVRVRSRHSLLFDGELSRRAKWGGELEVSQPISVRSGDFISLSFYRWMRGDPGGALKVELELGGVGRISKIDLAEFTHRTDTWVPWAKQFLIPPGVSSAIIKIKASDLSGLANVERIRASRL